MASNFALLMTFLAITSSFVLFSSEHRSRTSNVFSNATSDESSDRYPTRLNKREIFFSNDERKWIEAGRQRDIGWLMACSDLQHGPASVNRLVHHIQKSSANVLLIDSISDEALTTISQMPRLRALVIHNSDVTDAGLKHFLKMPHLETVGFYYCKVTQEGVDRIRQQMPEIHFEVHSPSRRGFVFKDTGCLSPKFLQAYFKKSSWR